MNDYRGDFVLVCGALLALVLATPLSSLFFLLSSLFALPVPKSSRKT